MNGERPATPEFVLARAFADHVADWSRDLGADDAAVVAARAAAFGASFATAQGHVCTDLDALAEGGDAGNAEDLRVALLASRVAGTPADPAAFPLIVDDEGRVYVRRLFDAERRLARRLVAARSAPSRAIDPASQALLHRLFARDGQPPLHGADRQMIAAALALLRPLSIVSGGPGTGKTTTLVNVLACLVAQAPACRIALAAPTGKAAARMQQAIRERAAALPEPLRAQLPVAASTVHRLLRWNPGTERFTHDARHPLPIDVLIVDEASMLDLALATRLLDAVPPSARIVLCGDKDQLAAVEAGAVFAELSSRAVWTRAGVGEVAAVTGIDAADVAAIADIGAAPLADSVVWLTENYRFTPGSGIGRLAAAINAGDAATAMDALRAGAHDVQWHDDAGTRPLPATLDAVAAGFDGYFQALLHYRRRSARGESPDPVPLFSAFEAFRVLCAEREGPRGAAGLNAVVERVVRERLEAAGDGAWFHGRPVMVERNDYALRLFNGDIGIALEDGDGAFAVAFPAPDGGHRRVAPARLPAHATAFASTVHKAQGSEFDAVLLVLPAAPRRVVTRELLYTAVTRARGRVTLAGGAEVIAGGIRNPTRRASGLASRLVEAAAAPERR